MINHENYDCDFSLEEQKEMSDRHFAEFEKSERKIGKCPWCKREGTLRETNMSKYFVACAVTKMSVSEGFCDVMPQTWNFDTPEEAIDAWNKGAILEE